VAEIKLQRNRVTSNDVLASCLKLHYAIDHPGYSDLVEAEKVLDTLLNSNLETQAQLNLANSKILDKAS
jgi:hypothetical protein